MSLENNWRGWSQINVCAVSGLDSNNGSLVAPKKNPSFKGQHNYIRSGYYRALQDGTYGLSAYLDGHVIIDFIDVIDRSSLSSGDAYTAMTPMSGIIKNSVRLPITRSCFPNSVIMMDCQLPQVRALRTLFLRGASYRMGNGNNDTLTTLGGLGGSFGNRSYKSSYISHPITYLTSDHEIIRCLFTSDSVIQNTESRSFLLNTCLFESGWGFDGVSINNMTLDGDTDTIGTSYSDGEKFSGTITNGTQIITILDCMWTADLGLNSDYSLRTSPQSLAFNDSVIIGCYDLHVVIDANHSAFDPANAGVSYTDVIRTTGSNPSFSLIASAQEGEVVSTNDPTACIDLGSIHTISEAINILGSFNYYNGDWVDAVDYKSGVSDQVRHTIDFQVYDENEPNGADNTSNWSGWISTEVFSPLQQDASGLGNGHIDADMGALENLSVRRLRVKFRMVEGALL